MIDAVDKQDNEVLSAMNFEWYENAAKALDGCCTPEHLRSVITRHLHDLGLQHWMVVLQVPSALHAPEVYGINNFDDAWWQEYIENNWVLHDPLPRYVVDNHVPRFWTLTGWADIPGHRWEQDDLAAIDFFKEVERFGARSGLIIPFHLSDNSRSCLNLPHPDPIEISREPLMLARIWVVAIMPQVITSTQRVYRSLKGDDQFPGVTPREKEILFWVGEGLTSKAIAEHLGISRRTVEHHLAVIQRKLGVSNRQQAVAKAVNLGLVTPTPLLDGLTFSIAAARDRFYQTMMKQ